MTKAKPKDERFALFAISESYSLMRDDLINQARLALATDERVGAFMSLLGLAYVDARDVFLDENPVGVPITNGKPAKGVFYHSFITPFYERLVELVKLSQASPQAQSAWITGISKVCSRILKHINDLYEIKNQKDSPLK